MKKIISIVGARPQIIKASAISRVIEEKFANKLEDIIVHTGQHYDENMSKVFFEEMGIPEPHYNLAVGSGTHAAQTAKMLEGLEQIFSQEKPSAVLVYGDTNSTLAGALAAIKMHLPVIHVEAGLRSFNKNMPEEVNRIACDHMSTLLFTPTKSGVDNLKKEGFDVSNKQKANVDHPKVFHCGDIMYDNSLHFSTRSESSSTIIERLKLSKNEYVLCTIHRDANTDHSKNLNNIFKTLNELSLKNDLDFVLPLHPRTTGKMNHLLENSLLQAIEDNKRFKIIPPTGFLDVISLEKNAKLVITDSGGLQKESYFFQKPCIILRPQTEWIEIVENGNAILTDSDPQKIVNAFQELTTKQDYTFPEFYGDGHAAQFICETIDTELP